MFCSIMHPTSDSAQSTAWFLEQMPVDPSQSEIYREEIGGGGGGWVPPSPPKKEEPREPAEEPKDEPHKPRRRKPQPK
jgi:hypothetical protein